VYNWFCPVQSSYNYLASFCELVVVPVTPKKVKKPD
jgi:hypothetical protein